MSTTPFERALEIRQAASALPQAERGAFLDRVCGDDAELRRAVEGSPGVERSTIAYAGAGSGYQERVTGGEAGQAIGAYTLIAKLGEGGFGDVWLAERKEPYAQRVAMKIVKPGMDSRAVLARFDQERQALARMEHPNIAQVLDGGVTPAGRPYFVMEYVQGETISGFARRRGLSPRERLELFLPVCGAVQHAHHKGIIHRDLKPSNILVQEIDGVPAPKVIDFGIAKAIDQTGYGRTLMTERGVIVGTPEYMSPEQAGGEPDIDTRTDVYSLGVVLYELLVGVPPFGGAELRSGGYEELRRIIREVEPPRPSTRVAVRGAPIPGETERPDPLHARALSRELRRELEWIPLKALRKDRDRRYSSPEAMAQDIRRYLAGEALEAGPESRGYRAKKFVARHALPLVAASAVLASLSVGLGAAMVQRNATRTAQVNADTTLKVLTDVLTGLNPSAVAGQDTTLLRGVVDGIELRLSGVDPNLDPQTFARVKLLLAGVRCACGQAVESERLLAECEPLIRDGSPTNSELKSTFFEVQSDLAVMRGDNETAVNAMLKSLEALPTDGPNAQTERAQKLSSLGLAYNRLGQKEEAKRVLTESLAINTAQLGPTHMGTLNSRFNLAVATEAEDPSASLAEYIETTVMLRSVVPPGHPALAAPLNNSAVLFLRFKQDPAAAEPLATESLAVRRKAYPQGHVDLVASLDLLGSIKRKLGAFEESERLYREAWEMDHRLFPDGRTYSGTIRHNHANVLRDLKRFDEALAEHDAAISLIDSFTPGAARDRAFIRSARAKTLQTMGRTADAIAGLKDAIEIATAGLPPDHPLLKSLAAELAEVSQSGG
ncbi:MAG: protein kinase domain-containing protein [Phycisphaerales bacterium]